MVCACQMKPHNLGVTLKYNPLAVWRHSQESVGWAESGLTQAPFGDGYRIYICGLLLWFLNATPCLELHRVQTAEVGGLNAPLGAQCRHRRGHVPFFQAEVPGAAAELCVFWAHLVSEAGSPQSVEAVNQKHNSNSEPSQACKGSPPSTGGHGVDRYWGRRWPGSAATEPCTCRVQLCSKSGVRSPAGLEASRSIATVTK